MRLSLIALSAIAFCAITPELSAGAFKFSGAAVRPDLSIRPSSGKFITQAPAPGQEGAFMNDTHTAIRNDRPTWRDNLDTLMASTWLAQDPYGPFGQDGTASYGEGWFTVLSGPSGAGTPVHVPTYNYSLATSTSGLAVNGERGDIDGDGLSPGFDGGSAGFTWEPGPDFGLQGYSERSLVNNRMTHSVFLGHFVLENPDATLIGDDIYIFAVGPNLQEDATIVAPLDGRMGRQVVDTYPFTLGDKVPYWLEYERTSFTNSLGTFTALDMYLVPAPATLLPLLALAPVARRRPRTPEQTPESGTSRARLTNFLHT